MNACRSFLVLSLVVICGCSKSGPPLTTKAYPIGSPYELELSFPATWQDRVVRFQESRTNVLATFDGIRFTPTNEERCVFQIVLIPLLGTNTPVPDLKPQLLQGGERNLSNTVETAIELQALQGGKATGYYYRVTDRKFVSVTPTPPDYKYLTEGLASLGPLVLSFRLWDNDKAAEEEALKVIRAARITTTTDKH